MAKLLKNKAFAAILIGGLSTLILSVFLLTNTFNGWHLKIADSLYKYDNPSDEIVIIAIDQKSTDREALGRYAQWSRENYVNLLQILGEDPKVIVFDLLFHTPTQQVPMDNLRFYENSIEGLTNGERLKKYEEFFESNSSKIDNEIDNKFEEKLKEFDNIVLAFSSNLGSPLFPLPKFSEKAVLGDAHVKLDEDGILRKSISYYEEHQSLGLATVAKYYNTGEEINVPVEDGEMNVNFFGNPYSYEMVSFIDVIRGEYETALFKDKIVMIGVTAPEEIHDTIPTPRSTIVEMPGVEFRANEIQTILEEKFLTNQSTVGKIATIALISIALALIIMHLGAILSTVIAIAAIVGYYLLAHVFFRTGLIVNMVYPFMAIILTFLASWVYKYTIADKKKREMKSAFGHYVSKKLVEEISKNPDLVKLGGEKRQVSVFFSDIKDSTKMSEQIETEKWVAQMNEYFTMMENVIKQVGGTIDKYEGDAIMGFFNAPLLQENHQALAHLCALEMKKALKILHQKWEPEGKPLIEFRIGINTGEAIVGNFGSKNRFDYTVMGDTVNTASRLESSANKTYGTKIIASGFENSDQIVVREIDTVLLPGKEESVKLYELVCTSKELTEEIKQAIQTYAAGLEAYRKKDFTTAISHFEKLTTDPPAQIMLERCRVLAKGEQVTGLEENMTFRIFNK